MSKKKQHPGYTDYSTVHKAVKPGMNKPNRAMRKLQKALNRKKH